MTTTPDWYDTRTPDRVFDETIDERGEVRPVWEAMTRIVSGLGAAELLRRRDRCDQLLAAHGATHLPHRELLDSTAGAPGASGWHLDPLPFVIGADDWAQLERLVTERALMLAALAADLSGPRNTVHSGVLPAAALYAEPSFLPTAPAGEAGPIVWYGVDVVRTADGRWRVLRDGTDAVRGVGESLMHRSILMRAIGDVSDRVAPGPLTGFLADFRSTLARRAPLAAASPRTVVLAPDEVSAAYVATSYLAGQLGFHRASSADLIVRDGRVFLRSLGGREPVDVVLRAIRAVDTDPLASPRRGLGVPGLVAAERTGDVAVANPIAGALVGSASVAPHLGNSLRFLTGRIPELASLDSHWCGDPAVLAEVRAHPDAWVLEDVMAQGSTGGTSVFASVLGDTAAHDVASGVGEDWRTRLRVRPGSIIARPRASFATVPVFTGERIEPGSVVLGLSALIDGDQVHVMPGGFARVIDPRSPVASQRSGWAKDIWVTAAAPRRARVRATSLPQVDLRGSLPTRAAEAMFWLGRASEAAELRARTVRTLGDRLAADPLLGDADGTTWAPTAVRLARAAVGALPPDTGDVASALDGVITARRGLLDQIDAILLAAATVREFLSTTTGRVLADISDLRSTIRGADADSLERLLVALAALAGLAQESTVRGPAWRMLDLGRRIERSLGVLGAVEASLGSAPTAGSVQVIGETLLSAHESLATYRRWHRTDIEVSAAVDLLVRDDSNPRSVAFQLDRIGEHLAALPAVTDAPELLGRATLALLDGGDVTTVVLAVRGPLLELVEVLVEQWFSDHIGPQRLGVLGA